MSNIIQIKRGNGKPDKKLAPYELGVQIDDDNKLFIGGALNKDGSYGDAQQIKVENATNAENASKLNNTEASNYILKSQIIGKDATEKVENATNATNAEKLGNIAAVEYVQKANIIGEDASSTVWSATNANKIKNNNNEYITFADMLNLIYPVGSIYITLNEENPQNLFGGIWVKIENRFLLAAGDGYLVNSTGGEATHTLTTSEMPSHSHQIVRPQWYSDNSEKNLSSAYGTSSNTIYTYTSASKQSRITNDTSQADIQPTGKGEAHNNMPPYLAVYMWQRTE